MKAILLGAGYGTRLYPLTLDKPKPLLPVGNKAIVEHILERIGRIPAIDGVLLVTNDKFASHFEAWKQGFQWTRPIEILNDGTTSNEDRLGAVGDIYFVLKQKGIDEEVLVVGGDNLFEFDLNRASGFFREKGGPVVGLYDMGDKEKVAGLYGVVSIDEDSRIVGFEEKPKNPKSSLVSTALYFLTPRDLQTLRVYIEEGNRPDNLGDFVRYLVERQDVYGYVFRENWFDIGSFEQLERANAHFSKAP
ncbi:MAG: nucleotidyltransferase family protein [Deltaproteobacteria bacterium]|nr:nucleotidyltransferase family protein [Deltaproteobacteria bacterium]MBW2122446.1 nucleotidyltransferase family protein [Deltaproteobacteria bacterium]